MPSLKQSIGSKQHISLDDVCFLSYTKITKDELLQEIETEIFELVYCSVLNIEHAEYGVTAQAGLKAKMVIVVDYDEYDNEIKLEYNRQIYYIYRPFVRDDGYVELYCEVRAGGN